MISPVNIGIPIDQVRSVAQSQIYENSRGQLANPDHSLFGSLGSATPGSCGGGGSGRQYGAPAPSFTVYWDGDKGGLYLYEPRVVSNGKNIKVSGVGVDSAIPDNSSGWLVVSSKGGNMKAEVKGSDPGSSDATLVFQVFEIKTGSDGFPRLRQFHTGAISLGGASFEGNTSDSETIFPSVAKFVSASDSNVDVKTSGDEIQISVYYV